MRPTKNLVGQRFGSLVALSICMTGKGHKTLWHCECDCGRHHVAYATHLMRGLIATCGSHGYKDKSGLGSWEAMRDRCTRPTHPHYARYGGRGISVCQEWLQSYEQFIADMGTKPDGMTLDRIDNDKGYEPGNCRWATPFEQSNNRGNNRFVEYQGARMTISQYAVARNICYNTAYSRAVRGVQL